MKEKAGKRNGLARCSQARSVALGASHWASQLTPTTAPTWVVHPMCRPTASGGLKRMSAWRWPRSGLGAHGTIAGWPCCTVAAWLRCVFKASSRPPRSKLAHIACTTTACGSSALSQSERPPHCTSTRRRSCSRGAGWNARDTSDGATLELRSWARSSTMSTAARNGVVDFNLLRFRLSASRAAWPLPKRSFPRCMALAPSPSRGPMDNPSVPS